MSLKSQKRRRMLGPQVLEIKANLYTMAYADLYLGMLYEFGGTGVNQDRDKALERFQAVLKQNDNKDAVASALFAIGACTIIPLISIKNLTLCIYVFSEQRIKKTIQK